MKQELEQILFEKYPKIFQDKNKDKKVTCMCWGIECPDSWYDLIDKLCHTLQYNTDVNKYPQVIAEQVKEKYGTLRFYCRLEGEKNEFKEGVIEGIIRTYEDQTAFICAKCGSNKNVKATKSGIQYLCEDCFNKK